MPSSSTKCHTDTVSGIVNLRPANYLSPDIAPIISSWFNQAWEAREDTTKPPFEPFIYAWFAFNMWAVSVSRVNRLPGKDKEIQDWEFIYLLSTDETLRRQFRDALANEESSLRDAVSEFVQFWPILDARAASSSSVKRHDYQNRFDYVKAYIATEKAKFQPRCWPDSCLTDPLDDGYRDWQHVLPTIYKVRCNLFHGQKMASSEEDQIIVRSAFRTLIYFMHGAKYL